MEMYAQQSRPRPLEFDRRASGKSWQLKGIADNRPEAVRQKKMLEAMSDSREAIRRTACRRDFQGVLSKSKKTPEAADVLQLSKDDVDGGKYKVFINKITNLVLGRIAKGEMPDKSTDELATVLSRESRFEIGRQPDEILANLYTAGKAPGRDIMLEEMESLFDEAFRENEEKIKKRIKELRIEQLEARQEKAKEISPLPAFRGKKKIVRVILAERIKDVVEWDVIWNRAMQLGFYPSHVVEAYAPYFDDLKGGSHFRKDKESGGNHFYEFKASEDVLELTIHDYWKKKHPEAKCPWPGVPKGTHYTDPMIFSVTGDKGYQVSKLPHMKKGNVIKGEWDITEAQRLALEQRNMRAVAVPADGFCLTNAVGISQGSDGALLRTAIINRLADQTVDGEVNLRIIQAFITMDNFVSVLTNPVAWTGVYGEDIISAIALVLNMNIRVINENGTITSVETPGADEDVYITRIESGGGHFGATAPLPPAGPAG